MCKKKWVPLYIDINYKKNLKYQTILEILNF